MEQFDIFISYKHTDANKCITKDHEIAENLHSELMSRGISTFFSSNSIAKLGDSEYKKVIDSALDSATVLIVVSTERSFIRSKWVEYEWESFEADILNSLKPYGKIFSYTSDILPVDLPRTIRNNQNFTIGVTTISEVADFAQSILDNARKNSTETKPADKSAQISESQPTRKCDSKPAKSAYDSSLECEYKRLKIQAKSRMDFDNFVIDSVINKLSDRTDLSVLVAGCEYGFVAESRFNQIPEVKTIIGIDINSTVISKANELHKNKRKLHFEVSDLEDPNFEDKMLSIAEKYSVEKFDMIFLPGVIKHLGNPEKVLRKLRKLLKDDGYIISRCNDDGSKLCYPGSELLDEIIKKTMEAKGIPDRQNGRKLFSQLVDSGFSDVKIVSRMRDTTVIAYDERDDWFTESFSFRLNYLERLLQLLPEDEEIKEQYEWMKDALERFEKLFFERDFWYCEYSYIGIGKK